LQTLSPSVSRRAAEAASPNVDPSEVFAALDKVLADTPLTTRHAAEDPATAFDDAVVPAAVPAPVRVSPVMPPKVEAITPVEPTFPEETLTNQARIVGVSSSPIPGEVPRRYDEAPTASLVPAVVRPMPAPVATVNAGRNTRQIVITTAIIVLSIIATVQAIFLFRGTRGSESLAAAAPATGIVSVQSTPTGAAVTVNGQVRGITPIALTLSPGDYSIEVANAAASRAVPVTVTAGTRSSQHVLFGGDEQARGGLQITSQPPGARVTIDKVARGVTPLTVADLAPGAHTVVLDGASGPSRQSVTIRPGTTSSLAVTMPVAGVSGGFVRVDAPFDVQLYEDGSLIGSSQSQRIMLPAGRHVIESVNAALGYRSTQTVQVSPGNTANIRIDAASVSVDINAVPWAEVTIGDRALGTTPLGNVQVPIGTHNVVFRHPQLGERRVTATVTVTGPNRVSVNMNQK
jgi:hypothetical protein